MNTDLYTDDFKTEPYWWDLVELCDPGAAALPGQADVVVIGSGYSGLNAALQIARAGRKTVVIEAQSAGWGASTRNGGQVSTSIKPDFGKLSAKYGPGQAFRILQEGHNSLAWLKAFIRRENIACDLATRGRFHGAHNASQYERLAKRIRNEPKGLETNAHLVPRSEQMTELGTRAYHGGVVYPRHASVNPAKLHRGLLQLVLAAGAEVIPHCPAQGIRSRYRQFSNQHRQRDDPMPRCDRRQQRLHGPIRCVAATPDHSDRQLHHRD